MARNAACINSNSGGMEHLPFRGWPPRRSSIFVFTKTAATFWPLSQRPERGFLASSNPQTYSAPAMMRGLCIVLV